MAKLLQPSAEVAGMPPLANGPAIAMPISGRLGAVDSLRGVAVLMVYLYHAWQTSGSPSLTVGYGQVIPIGTFLNTLRAGVDLFMVLSGFCLFWPTAKRPESAATWSWRNFARRRIERIVPPYYASLVFVTILPVAIVLIYKVTGHAAKWQQLPDAFQYFTHLLFVHTLFPTTWSGIQGAYWSLGLEMQFYLVFPLVIRVYRQCGIRVVWYMTGSCLIYRIVSGLLTQNSSWEVEFLWSVTFLGRWMEFAAGVLAAWIVARKSEAQPVSAARTTTLLLAAMATYVLATSLGDFSRVAHIMRDLLLSGCFATALVAVCSAQGRAHAVFNWKPMTRLGLISYSLFLVHQNLSYYMGEFLKKVLRIENSATQFVLLATVVLAAVVAFSIVFFRCFEFPFLRRQPAKAGEALFLPAMAYGPVTAEQ